LSGISTGPGKFAIVLSKSFVKLMRSRLGLPFHFRERVSHLPHEGARHLDRAIGQYSREKHVHLYHDNMSIVTKPAITLPKRLKCGVILFHHLLAISVLLGHLWSIWTIGAYAHRDMDKNIDQETWDRIKLLKHKYSFTTFGQIEEKTTRPPAPHSSSVTQASHPTADAQETEGSSVSF
jgi:hypothetical protein